MAWMRFTRDFDWKPTSAVTIAYRTGMVENVTRACAASAEAKGAARRATKADRGLDAEGASE